MGNKNNFIMYTDYYGQLQFLTLEQKGVLLDALFLFQMGEEIPDLDPVTKMAFSFISSDIRRNNDKYEHIVEVRREAGKKRKQQMLANQANADFVKQNEQMLANATDNDNVNDNENDNDNDNDNVSVNDNVGSTNTQNTSSRPDLGAVQQEANKLGVKMSVSDAEEFIRYNNALNWKLEWKYALQRWVDQESKRPKGKPKIKTAPSEQHYYDKDELRRRAKE